MYAKVKKESNIVKGGGRRGVRTVSLLTVSSSWTMISTIDWKTNCYRSHQYVPLFNFKAIPLEIKDIPSHRS